MHSTRAQPSGGAITRRFSRRTDDQDIKLWTYKHENLEFATNPYAPGDRVIKISHNDPNTAVVVECPNGANGDEVTVASLGDFDEVGVWPGKLADHCAENGIKYYTYEHTELKITD